MTYPGINVLEDSRGIDMHALQRITFMMISLVALIHVTARAEPTSTAFMYQGQLKANGAPADGAFGFRFQLFQDPDGSSSVGTSIVVDGVNVADGLFTVELDFGPAAFAGDRLWLEVSVRQLPSDLFSVLTPRHPIGTTPYAAYALSGTSEFWSVNGTDIHNTNSGNVGIGTTVPSASLHVENSGGQTAVLASSPWIGVHGKHASTSGTFPGVWGETDSLVANATGLRGYVTSTSPGSGSVGVLGLNKGTAGAGIGVKGQQDGSGWGVYGTTPSGTGVYGQVTADSGVNYGVRGTSSSPSGFGGHFRNTSSDGTALYAQSAGGGRDDATLQVHNTRASTGMAAYITSVGSWATTHIQNNGSGEVLWLARDNSDGPFIVAYNEETGRRAFSVQANGWTSVSILEITGGADLSEQFQVDDLESDPAPGTVVSIDPDYPGKLTVSHEAYDRKVAGVISGAGGVSPGMVMGQRNSIAAGDYPVALTGRVYVMSDASRYPIAPGDLLTTSDISGHAMKVIDHSRAQGAIIGKAMTSLSGTRGLVLVLVTLQ